ncbi:TPA: hypothetical protein DCK82_05670 [Candidatus Beckwithbacteria bacterium]|nr:hypothetical protein [Candidatus Beckwithbacteria bacterium]
MQLYTVRKAAQIVGCSTNTLYKYLNEGRIKASRGTKHQGRFRIPQTSLEEFLGAPLKTTPASPAAAGKNLPLKLIRGLILLGLGLILIDAFSNRTVSLTVQLNRLLFLTIALLLAYQQGGYLRR